MKIEKLQLKNFRRFDTLTVEFGPEVNVIVGPNEQGKSTIVHALIAGLFYDPLKKARAEIIQNQKWGSEQLYSIMITFRVGNDEYFLSKDFENHTLLLRGPEGQAWKTFPEVTEKMRELTGFSEPSLYKSSALILQNKIAEIHSSRSELAKVLQELVSSDKENVNVLSVLRSLDREIRVRKKGWASRVADPGPLRRAKDELERLTVERIEAESIVHDVRHRVEENQKLQKKRKEIIGKLAVSERLLQENTLLFDSQEEMKRLSDAFQKIEQRLRLLQQLEEKLQDFATDALWRVFENEDPERIIAEMSHATFIKSEKTSSWVSNSEFRIGLGLIIGGLVIAIFGFFVNPVFFIGSLGVLIGGALLWRVRARTRMDATAKKHTQNATLERFGVENVEALMKKLQAYRIWKEKKQELKIQYETLLGEQPRATLEEERTKISVQLVALQAQQKELDAKKMLSPHELSRLEQEVKDMKREKEEIEESMIRNSALIQNARKTEGDLAELIEQEEDAKMSLNRELSSLHIYELIRENLDEAQRTTMTSVQDVLQKKIEDALPRITQNRYNKVRVSSELDIEIFIPELNDFVAPEDHVSQGTIDQIYLVARFALAEAQSEGRTPPLILDDPFVTFDAERKKAAMELLRDLSKNFQILLFTYSNEYNPQADTIIDFAKAIT